jgi:hypothetical protein
MPGSLSYNIPARPNDVITLQARALDNSSNVFFNQHGDVICSGRGWTIRPN